LNLEHGIPRSSHFLEILPSYIKSSTESPANLKAEAGSRIFLL
jgi:hypothetical protein